MADKYEFKEIIFNNERLMVVQNITDQYLGEVLLCLGDNGRVYLNNNEIITNQEIIDSLDEQYWLSPNLRNIEIEQSKHNSIRELNKGGITHER